MKIVCIELVFYKDTAIYPALQNIAKDNRLFCLYSSQRRTDIPAFYGDWFMNRIKEGLVGYMNPFGGQKYLISLKQEDVLCFVFWSKNFEPFHHNLYEFEEIGS
ncbi:MAG: DUF1848 domain-containing protein [Bacteroidetes bacterium]|nr:DUF1848 domain-containing protein [Bacteroidota bacterium]